MVKARKAKGQETAVESERVQFRFPDRLMRDLTKRVAAYAVDQTIDAQRGLKRFSDLALDARNGGDGDWLIDAPIGAWNWLIGHAMHFAPDFCQALIVQISEHEERGEREQAQREQAENDAALKLAADELRAREAAEVAGG